MRESGLPIDLPSKLQLACRPILRQLMDNATYAAYRGHGWLEAPMLRYMAGPHMMTGSCGGGGPGTPTVAAVGAHPVS